MNAVTKTLVLGGGCLCVLVALAGKADAGTNVYVGAKVQPNQTIAIDQIDHSAWNDLLRRYVDERGGVDYGTWKASAVDRGKLDRYLKQLSKADRKKASSSKARLAFWINAYNAVTVKGILREYPTTSIRNHTAKLFGYNIWDDFQLYVGGTPVSLNQMEHEILRKMDEPRIHFAIVCASKGCPRLLREAYVAESVDEQFDANAKHFFRQRQNFSIRGNVVTLSSILDWFGEDFGTDEKTMLRRIKPWVPSTLAADLNRSDLRVRYADYDWSINEQ